MIYFDQTYMILLIIYKRFFFAKWTKIKEREIEMSKETKEEILREKKNSVKGELLIE